MEDATKENTPRDGWCVIWLQQGLVYTTQSGPEEDARNHAEFIRKNYMGVVLLVCSNAELYRRITTEPAS